MCRTIRRQVQTIRDVFVDEPDMHDTTMVSEYAEEIFQYMSELEVTFGRPPPPHTHRGSTLV